MDRLLPWRTVWENIRLVREPEDPAGIQELIDAVGLKGFEAYYPGQLSGGMQKRCGIARAFYYKGELLLMDEPMGALDAFTREQVQEILLRAWKATQKMVFFITHSVEEALFLATRLIVMSPSPGRVSHVYEDLPFSHEFLDTNDARAVKSRPDFIRLREEVLGLIHHREK